DHLALRIVENIEVLGLHSEQLRDPGLVQGLEGGRQVRAVLDDAHGLHAKACSAMVNPLYAALPTTVFSIMSGLAREHGAINLAQGSPAPDGPLATRERAARAILDGPNQYPPMPGLPELRAAVADYYGRTQGVALDWAKEVTITSGATEA